MLVSLVIVAALAEIGTTVNRLTSIIKTKRILTGLLSFFIM